MPVLRWQEVSCNLWNVPLLLTRDRRGQEEQQIKYFLQIKYFHPETTLTWSDTE